MNFSIKLDNDWVLRSRVYRSTYVLRRSLGLIGLLDAPGSVMGLLDAPWIMAGYFGLFTMSCLAYPTTFDNHMWDRIVFKSCGRFQLLALKSVTL